jgi:hypothetical protein
LVERFMAGAHHVDTVERCAAVKQAIGGSAAAMALSHPRAKASKPQTLRSAEQFNFGRSGQIDTISARSSRCIGSRNGS